MAHSVQIQTVVFDIPLRIYEVEFFRKAICSVVRKLRTPLLQAYVAPDWFHNHDEEPPDRPINRYPIIQYKTINGKAAVTGIRFGAYALDVLLQLLRMEQNQYANFIHINGERDVNLNNPQIIENYSCPISLLDNLKQYHIKYWLPMEEEPYTIWKETLSLQDRLEILNESLPRQIAAFLNASGFREEISFNAFVSDINKTEWLKEFHVPKLAFDCKFWCNLDLPGGIGIGQVPSIGFGIILPY